ncbi:MAG TPA: CPBP family glutamic-type intramembrane protease [Thermoanaerobaculia bacterium]|nr:CPBP family glutamic-type intramembrane protease [Thermoanaerobaculia bacterium]
MQRLSDNDKIFLAICVALVLSSVAIVIRYFDAAFPQAAVDFKVDRNTSSAIAERFLKAQRVDVRGMKHAARFESDDTARIFLERTIGLEEANRVTAEQVHVWAWRHRWFRPLVEEEYSVDVAPSGEIIGFTHRIPEERAAPPSSAEPPLAFLTGIGINAADLNLVDQSERKLPNRVQRIFTWESSSVRPAGAPYRHTVTVDGNLVTSYAQHLKVPDGWIRAYQELRSKNIAAGRVDLIFHAVLLVAAVVVFIVRLRRGDLPLRFLLGIGLGSMLLVGGVAVNNMPAQLAYYDTTESYAAFIGRLLVFDGVLQSLGTAMLLIVLVGSGEVLYRERLPKQLAMPRIWSRKALASKRVFLSLILGYALVPAFIAYQVVFYLGARKFGAWAPAEVPYDDLLNSALPWVAVLFAGFFPAVSEEFLSRAFSIPIIQKLVRSRWTAIILAGFIWGFGHSTYPNQPFWIRGVEVGIAGIIAGVLMDRFGLLPLLIWHYTIDAVYTATVLFSSGNTYYIVSAAMASLVFAVPLIVSIALYVRNKGFIPDDDLNNASMPVAPPEPEPETAIAAAQFPEAQRVTRTRVIVCVALVIAAAVAIAIRPSSPSDAMNYRISSDRAKQIARDFVGRVRHAYVIATPVEGFRSWDASSSREDGGAPGGFDDIAATWLVRSGTSVETLIDIFRTRIQAGTWTVRFFTPLQKEELFVEVDPRTERVLGFHLYLDEEKPARSLSREEALALAQGTFDGFGIDVTAFELKEALSFQQPRRRDWLFHFDERTPLAPRAFRRVTVRVAGGEVTQFTKSVKIPDSVYREATTQTLLNVVLFAIKILGLVTLLAFVIAGLVTATRAHGLPWKRALRWSLILSVIPIAGFAVRSEALLFGYSTAMAWETFRVGLVTSFVREVGLQTGLMFLALAGLEAAVPYALSLVTRDGRARFGRAAVIAAVTALAIATLYDAAMQLLAHAFPQSASVSLNTPLEVATALPALVEFGQALFGAVIFAAAIALFTTAVRKHVAAFTIAAIFCASVDPLATASQTPMMLARALLIALLVWVAARYVLDGNPLAWPLAAFLGSMTQAAAMLLEHQRTDLQGNAIALIVIALAAIAWMVRPPTMSRTL